MDERIAIGQHLFAGFTGLSLSADFVHTVNKHKIGNVILFGHNVGSAAQLKTLCTDIQKLVIGSTGYPAFIAIDQEGGTTSRLSEDCTIMPGAMAIAATGKPENAYLAGLITGRELCALGINFNLAPVCDINSNPDNPVIGTRSYGDTPGIVAEYALEMARGLTESGLLCCAKHFPGHGDTDVDSHVGLPVIHKNLEELTAFELIPFQAVIDAGIPAVMSTHILFPQIERERVPATMSLTILSDLLRARMGFDGLVLSDCMMMAAIADHYGTVRSAVQAINAGVDLAFISHSAELAAQACELLRADLQTGLVNPALFRASTERILWWKQGLKKPDTTGFEAVGGAEHRRQSQSLHEQALTIVHLPPGGLPALGTYPLLIGCLPPRQGKHDEDLLPFAEEMCRCLGGEALTLSDNPDADEVARVSLLAPGHSCVVMGTCGGHLQRGQLAVVRSLSEGAVPVICIALCSPYDLADLPPQVSTIAAYAYTPATLRALSRLLAGEIQAGGRLPVQLKGR